MNRTWDFFVDVPGFLIFVQISPEVDVGDDVVLRDLDPLVSLRQVRQVRQVIQVRQVRQVRQMRQVRQVRSVRQVKDPFFKLHVSGKNISGGS